MSSIGQGSVSIDDSTLIAEKATTIADDILNRVEDLGNDNKLTPTEKIKLRQEYNKDLELYKLDVKQLQNINLPTTELDVAIGELTNFITPYFKNMDVTENVDRDQLNHVFTMFATADKNASQTFVNMIQKVADDAKKAGDDAKKAGEQAQVTGEAAKASAEQAQTDATKAKADASAAQQKAQSSIDQLNETSKKLDGEITEAKKSAEQAQSSADNALSSASSAVAKAESTASEFGKVSQKADSAFDNAISAQNDASAAVAQASSAAKDSKDAKQIAGAVSQSYKTLTDGSTMTIAELQNGLATKLTKSDLNGYATQTWAQNKIKTTADGINGTMSSIKGTVDGHTTSINNLQADSSSFKSQFTKVNNTLGKQTTDIGSLQASSKELSSNFNSLSTDNNTNKNDISQLKQTATEVSSTLETVQTQVQNSAVGTNLLVGTSRDLQTAPDSSGKLAGGRIHVFSSDELSILKSNQVTARAFIHNTTTHSVNLVMWTDKGDFGVGTDVPAGTDGYSTITAYSSPSSITRGDIDIRAYTENTAISGVQYKELKLEKGDLATDWCPNPADTATKSQITQLSGQISSKVSTADFTTYQTQTANMISQTVTNAVDGISIGGRNIVLDSSNMGSFRIWQADGNSNLSDDKKEITITSSHGGINIVKKNLSENLPNNGDTIVISADVKGNSHLQFNYNNGNGFVGSGTNIAVTTDYKRYSTTFEWNPVNLDKTNFVIFTSGSVEQYLTIKNVKIEIGNKATDWSPAPEDLATSTEIDQLNNAIKLKANSSDVTSQINVATKGVQSEVDNKISGLTTQINQTSDAVRILNANAVSQSDITASINNIHMGVKGADGSTSTFNMNNNTILLDANKIIINGNTSIQNGTIGTAKIANAAINTAQIADGAINNAKIANAAINDAKIANLNGNKIIAGSITSQQLNADDIIANVINGKTINGITINTPNLNLGTNGVLTEDWNLNQNTGWFQPKKGTGTTTLDTGVLRMSGNLSRWWDGSGSDQYWYGIGDNGDKIKNGSNSVTDDYAPGYEKHDIVGSSGVLLRSYLDATGLYLNQNSTKTVMVALTQKGLDTGGYIHAQQNSVVDKWFDAGVDAGTGIRIGYRAIQAHGSNDIYFNTDSAVGALTLHAKNFAASSQLSRKKDISPLEEEQAMETIMNTDIYRYHYKDETESEPYNYSVIIDDVHEKPQYKTPEEFIIADRTGRNDGNAVGFLIQALKNANRRISALEEIINEGK